MSTMRYCKECNSDRKDEVCPKCKIPTIVPSAHWEPLNMPPIEQIRELAKEVGYAIGVHGTMERDLDLIAMPWTEEALKLNYREVMEHIAKGLGGRVIEVEAKPLGRRACTIQMNGWYKPIDLSVPPMHVSKAEDAAYQAFMAKDEKVVEFDFTPEKVDSWPSRIVRDFEKFQAQVVAWFKFCFTDEAEKYELEERSVRFAEEAIELVQTCGTPAEKLHRLIDHVYARPVGEFEQEVGGVSTTLAVLCAAKGANLVDCAFNELARIWTKIPVIRAKQKEKIH